MLAPRRRFRRRLAAQTQMWHGGIVGIARWFHVVRPPGSKVQTDRYIEEARLARGAARRAVGGVRGWADTGEVPLFVPVSGLRIVRDNINCGRQSVRNG
jgi:hypothetical protein